MYGLTNISKPPLDVKEALCMVRRTTDAWRRDIIDDDVGTRDDWFSFRSLWTNGGDRTNCGRAASIVDAVQDSYTNPVPNPISTPTIYMTSASREGRLDTSMSIGEDEDGEGRASPAQQLHPFDTLSTPAQSIRRISTVNDAGWSGAAPSFLKRVPPASHRESAKTFVVPQSHAVQMTTGGLAGLLGMRWKSSEAAAGILVGGCELNMVAPSMFTTNTTIGRMVQGESPRSAIPTLEMMVGYHLVSVQRCILDLPRSFYVYHNLWNTTAATAPPSTDIVAVAAKFTTRNTHLL
ncbi:hypothetical protein BD410DRAFT_808152 [Rickenella mellea]|uniref:Uncharacterized protein n=1 Tax=Rickenella mellea TaxID=50990 RepID=A0A4Y7PLU6_9AGAM|nr:hypothetical protein BD410DRAFT_808152 [Rickenella mellea]